LTNFSISNGDNIEYAYSDSQHQNPLCTVVQIILGNDSLDYDKEKYKEMLLDASENVLGIFWIR
jgi:hypothetical protein